VCLAALVFTAPAFGAAPKVAVEGLQLGLAGNENLYKVGAWTPLRVQLKAGAEPFAGFMEVVIPDDHGTPTVFHSRAISLGANATEWFPAYTRPGTLYTEITIRLLDKDGRRVGQEWVSSSIGQQRETDSRLIARQRDLQSLGPEQALIVTLGSPAGVNGIANLPGFKGGNRSGDLSFVKVAPIATDSLPARWYGYDAAEAVVIDTNDRAAMNAVEAGRGEALKAWVRGGGHLVVAVASNWQQVRDSVLADILPAELGGLTQIDDLGSLESFAGSSRPISGAGSPRVTVARLEKIEARGGKALDSTTAPLVVRGPYGFGRVTLIGIDVDQKPFAVWDDRALFWSKAIDLRQPAGESNPTMGPGGGALYQPGETDLSTRLHRSLEQFPGVRLVPFGWVAFFIFIYILLIGPGDYFFLKKVLKRMELTWVTFPLIVLTVSLAAYFAAYAFKGTELKVNKVDVMDLDEEKGLMRGSSFFTAFSPQNRDYSVAVVPESVNRTAGTGAPGASNDRLLPDFDMLMSWFGVPESVFGGMTNPGGMGFSASAYEYAPMGRDDAPDKPETLRHVRVPIWSTRSFTARWSGPARERGVDAELELVGTDRLSGTVTNRLEKPLKDAVLVFGKVVYMLGTIAPRQSVQVELKTDRTLAGYLGDLRPALAFDPRAGQAGDVPRSALVRLLLFRDAAGHRAGALASNPLHYLDLSSQLPFDRPMLVADLDGQACSLALGGASAAPQIAQTTVVRFILGLKKGNEKESESSARPDRP
jgi:hypothetical protein